MASVIKVRTISAATETAIQMSNSRWARPIPIVAGWSHIRLGIRWHLTDSGGNLTGTPNFFLGICSGTTNIVGDATPTHAAGVRTVNSTWTRGSTAYFINAGSSGGNLMTPAVNVGGVWTNASTANAIFPTVGFGAGTNTADRTIIFIDITKGALISGTNYNYDFNVFSSSNGTVPDQSSGTFLTQMALSTPSLSSYTYSAAYTLAVDEAVHGTLNTFNVYWDRTDALAEICDIAYSQLA